MKVSPVVKTTPNLNDPGLKSAYKCLVCNELINRCDRAKYHIICHHWKLRPYKCPLCDLYKYQKEKIITHIAEKHPGAREDPVNVCDARLSELTALIERVNGDVGARDTVRLQCFVSKYT